MTINTRIEKHILALKCLLAAHALAPSNPTLHTQKLHFLLTLNSLPPDTLATKIVETITPELDTLLPSRSDSNLATYNNEFLEKHKSSPEHAQSALKVNKMLSKEMGESDWQQWIETLELGEIELEGAVKGLQDLEEMKAPKEVREAYKERARRRWKEASALRES
jgi:hypothetical protein